MEIAEVTVVSRTLSQAERNDLRLKVLRNEGLTVEEARLVFESLRQRQTEESALRESKPKRASKGVKKAMTDDDLNKSLGDLGL